MPTNCFLLISYIIDNYLSNYEVWITAMDINNRDILFNTNKAYENSWHTNIGRFESATLNKWI